MTKRELVMAALAGREANRVPLAVTTQTSPRNYPGSCSQRAPKSPKVDGVRSANLRAVVWGALALVSI